MFLPMIEIALKYMSKSVCRLHILSLALVLLSPVALDSTHRTNLQDKTEIFRLKAHLKCTEEEHDILKKAGGTFE